MSNKGQQCKHGKYESESNERYLEAMERNACFQIEIMLKP